MPLALDLTQTTQTVMGTTAGATTSVEGCAGGADVFYRFTLTRPEVLYVDTFGTGFDTHLGIVRGDCAIAVGACVNDSCGGRQSQLVRVLDAGTYVLAVDGATGASGAFTLRVQHLPVGGGAVNELPNVSGTQMLSATTSGASAYATSCGGGGAGPEVAWWLATCPDFAATTLTASTCGGASFDTVLEARSAANGATTCNDDACGTQSTIMAPLPAGAGLHVVVLDGYGAGNAGPATVISTLSTGGGCPTGQTSCGGSCVDTQTSTAHCGACNNACGAGQSCVAGTCMAMSFCGNGFVDGGEQCDDGNRLDNDGCESDCRYICQRTVAEMQGAFRAIRDPNNDHCYLGFTQRLPWAAARTSCTGMGGYLAVVQSGAENLLARSATNAAVQAWIGFHDLDAEAFNNPRGFQDVLGGIGTSMYSAFGGGEPNNNTDDEDCVTYFEAGFRPPGTTWNDARCGLPYHYVCEFDTSM
jgi:cysteine-rich repeat protein